MNKVRKTVSVLLVTLLALAMPGCFMSGDVSKAFERTAKGYGIKQVDKQSDLIRATSKVAEEGSGYYIAADEKEATKLYQSYFVSKNKTSDIKADDFRYLSIREKGDRNMQSATAFTIAFGSKDDAKKVFEALSDKITSGSRVKGKDSGEKNGCSYTITYEHPTLLALTVMGLYLEDKNVTYIQATSLVDETNAFAEYFCKKMGYVSPMGIVKDLTMSDIQNSIVSRTGA